VEIPDNRAKRGGWGKRLERRRSRPADQLRRVIVAGAVLLTASLARLPHFLAGPLTRPLRGDLVITRRRSCARPVLEQVLSLETAARARKTSPRVTGETPLLDRLAIRADTCRRPGAAGDRWQPRHFRPAHRASSGINWLGRQLPARTQSSARPYQLCRAENAGFSGRDVPS
jgi:hypothetical protein